MVNKYHQKHNKKLPKEAHERYENLSEGEKEKSIIRNLGRNNLSIEKIIV